MLLPLTILTFTTSSGGCKPPIHQSGFLMLTTFYNHGPCLSVVLFCLYVDHPIYFTTFCIHLPVIFLAYRVIPGSAGMVPWSIPGVSQGFDEILMPGEPESREEERRKVDGVPLQEDVVPRPPILQSSQLVWFGGNKHSPIVSPISCVSRGWMPHVLIKLNEHEDRKFDNTYLVNPKMLIVHKSSCSCILKCKHES